MKEYFKITRSGTYGFLMALPLMLGYEVMTLLSGTQIRVSSAVWIKQVLNGVTHSHFGLAAGVIIFGTAVMYRERERELPIKPAYFGGMLGESIILVPIFALTVGFLTAKAVPPSTMAAGVKSGSNVLQIIGISMGAGVYEEFLFRVCLIGFLGWGGGALFPKHKVLVYSIASVVSALAFSAVHYTGPRGYEWNYVTFIYRALAGLILNGIYLSRGFGVAAWTHALYDVVVLMHEP
jgi:membrane protease YdiL (CAAX protease family)